MSIKFPTDILTVRSIATSDANAVVSASSSLDAEGICMYSMNKAGLIYVIYSHHIVKVNTGGLHFMEIILCILILMIINETD